MNLNPFVFVFLWLLAMAVLVGVSWWRKWHREWNAARHTYHAAQQNVEAATVFYGSMQLDPALERHHVSGQNWRERTMVELSPEALDPGPGADPPLAAAPGPDQAPALAPGDSGHDGNGEGRAFHGLNHAHPASLAPVHERLAAIGDIHEAHQTHPHPEDGWLDAQLADLYDWVRTQLEVA